MFTIGVKDRVVGALFVFLLCYLVSIENVLYTLFYCSSTENEASSWAVLVWRHLQGQELSVVPPRHRCHHFADLVPSPSLLHLT